ncbi:MAG: hypothetical protein OXF67_07045 [Cyanobacteria bacterium MAG CAR4_bin_6]|nr:hypothetical protein [Cyanobacteria bacterium MAG CAR4_bin_6]MCY4235509.1 hypothetical protein [Cyanobacteria bacterium MAG CAR2_bin_4]
MNPFSSPLLRRVLQFMAAATTVLLVLVVHGWQHQSRLMQRFYRSVEDEDPAACVVSGEQLAGLRSLAIGEATQLARCRRTLASDYWVAGQHQQALDLLERLVASPQMVEADQSRFSEWVRQQRDRAVEHYRRGELSTAVALLEELSDRQEPHRDMLIESLRTRWHLNQQLHNQALQLRYAGRWWEAHDAIHRMDHPWWRTQAKPLEDEIVTATQALSGQGVGHDGHNGKVRHNVPFEDLDHHVRLHLTRGVDEWHAYLQACDELGGAVVNYGPESVCRR